MLSWAHGPVTARLWGLDYLNGVRIKRRNFVLEEILCRVTFLRGNSSVTLLIQEDGAVRVGEFQASSLIALLHPKLRWKQWEKKKGGRLVNFIVSCISGMPQKSLEIILPAASKAHIKGCGAPGASPLPHH